MSAKERTDRIRRIGEDTGHSKLRYMPGLDGIRAVSLVLVYIYHARPGLLPGAVLAIDVFFVLSGYLITRLLLGERDHTGKVDLRRFYLQRARRLLPALFTVLGALALWLSFFQREALGSARGDIVAGLLYVSNWYQILTGASYTAANDFAPLRNLWSLAIEEQFYILWPPVLLILLILFRRHVVAVALLVGALLVSAAGAAVTPTGALGACGAGTDAYWRFGERCIGKLDVLYLSTPTRVVGLLLGAALGLLLSDRSARPATRKILDAGSLLSIATLAWFAANVGILRYVVDVGPVANGTLFRGGFLVISVAALVVVAAATRSGTLTAKLFSWPALTSLGRRSYGIYLYHWPVFQVIRQEAGVALTWSQLIVATAITLALSESTYRLVEMPVRRDGFRAYGLRIVRFVRGSRIHKAGALTTAVSFFAVGSYVVYGIVTASPKPNQVQQSLNDAGGFVVDVASMLPEGAEYQAPHFPVFAVGDSIMKSAAEALAEAGVLVDAQEGRQGRTGAEILTNLKELGVTMDAAIIHLGTNGPVSSGTLEEIASAVGDVPRVVLLTAVGNGGWVADHNKQLYALASRFPNITVVDWNLLLKDCPGDCVSGDDIHLKEDGIAHYTATLLAAIK